MDMVSTVSGPVRPQDLGYTLMHEHIFINMVLDDRGVGVQNDYPLMLQELNAFVEQGGQTVVDLTTHELSLGAAPDPAGSVSGKPSSESSGCRSEANVLALRDIALDSGLNVILGTGYYRDPYMDHAWFDRHDAAWISDRITLDIEEGIGDTGVKAGLIGEVGADKWYISAPEERALRGAARAQKRTDVTISTHAARWPVGIPQLDLFKEEGVDPSRVIIGHCDTVNIPAYHEEIARRGAFVQFDTIRGNKAGTKYDLNMRVGMVLNLVQKGYVDQILLSHDIGRRNFLHIHDGTGFDFILTGFRQALLEAGLAPELMQRILVDNPRRALTGERLNSV